MTTAVADGWEPTPPPPYRVEEEQSPLQRLVGVIVQLIALFFLMACQQPEVAAILIERFIQCAMHYVRRVQNFFLGRDDDDAPSTAAATAAAASARTTPRRAARRSAPPTMQVVPLPRQYVLHSKLARFQQRFDRVAAREDRDGPAYTSAPSSPPSSDTGVRGAPML